MAFTAFSGNSFSDIGSSTKAKQSNLPLLFICVLILALSLLIALELEVNSSNEKEEENYYAFAIKCLKHYKYISTNDNEVHASDSSHSFDKCR